MTTILEATQAANEGSAESYAEWLEACMDTAERLDYKLAWEALLPGTPTEERISASQTHANHQARAGLYNAEQAGSNTEQINHLPLKRFSTTEATILAEAREQGLRSKPKAGVLADWYNHIDAIFIDSPEHEILAFIRNVLLEETDYAIEPLMSGLFAGMAA